MHQAFQPLTALVGVATIFVEHDQRDGQPQPQLQLAAELGPVERGPQIVELGVQSVQPDQLLGAMQLRLRLLGQSHEVRGVPAATLAAPRRSAAHPAAAAPCGC